MTTGNRWDWSAIDEFLAAEGLRARAQSCSQIRSGSASTALCYVEHNGRVLMLRRRKEPFAGHWTAPGGKLLPVRIHGKRSCEKSTRRHSCSSTGQSYA